jgi:hypothetical protein
LSRYLSPIPPSGSPYAQPPGDVQHVQLRRRILDGHAQEDLGVYIERRIGPIRARAWGQPSRTSNPLRDLSAAVAVLYDLPPVLAHAQASVEQVAEVTDRLSLSGLWQVAAEAQHLTEALNEAAIRCDVEDGLIFWRVVTPDLLEGQPLPGRPGEPGVLREWRVRMVGGDPYWMADEFSVLDRDRPHYRIIDADGIDRTKEVLGDIFDGEAYPYRYGTGRPFIPLSLRHASRAPMRLFSPWARVETVDGTLEAGLDASMMGHVKTQASFPTTVIFGANPRATVQKYDAKGQPIAQEVILDPSAWQFMEATDPAQQPSATVLRNETDVLALQELAERQAAGLSTMWGLGPSDIQRTAADARSGIALQVSETGRRRMQAARAPVYQRADEVLIGRACAMLNRAAVGGITDRPESGWTVRYTLSPLSPQERSQRQSEAEAMLDRRLITPAEARAMITGEDLITASRTLAAINATTPEEPTP